MISNLYILQTKSNAIAQQNQAEAEYLAKRSELQNLVDRETQRVVPPKPQTVNEWIKILRYHGTRTLSDADKMRVFDALQQAQYLLEESYAFWGTK